jgi:hypothetical protein
MLSLKRLERITCLGIALALDNLRDHKAALDVDQGMQRTAPMRLLATIVEQYIKYKNTGIFN